MLKILPYLLPLAPFLTRLFLLKYRKLLPEIVPPEDRQVDANRSLLTGFLSLTFAGLLALAIADARLKLNEPLPIYYILISFLSYYTAFSLQAYTFYRWTYLISETLMATASLSLMLCIAATAWLYGTGINNWLVVTLTSSVWVVDEIAFLYLTKSAYDKMLPLQQASHTNHQGKDTRSKSGKKLDRVILYYLFLLILFILVAIYGGKK